MIPTMNIIAWGNKVPWAAQRQVEQDLIISRALIEMFTDPVLSRQLRKRAVQRSTNSIFLSPIAIKVRVVEILTCYLEKSGLTISRAMAQERMFAQLAEPAFLTDMRPLVSSDRAETLNEETMKDAFRQVFSELIDLIPGDDWKQTPDMIERFALKDHVRRPEGSIPENSL